MESLAPELLNRIFTSACTDGGLTGCSLSSVSKHIRVTSRAARFHSISLTGSPLRMAQFLSCFLVERAGTAIRTPTIRHLHLVTMTNKKPWIAPDKVSPELRRIAEEADKYVGDIVTLFRLVAQDLETLSLVHNYGFMRLVELSDIECPAGGFPMLRELTLAGADPFVATDTASALSPFYPQLKLLHLGFPTYFSWQMSLTPWSSRAPSITDLCLSEIKSAPPAVEDLVGDTPRLRNLRHLLMRPIGPPAGPYHGGHIQQHADMLEAFTLFCESAATGIRAEVVPNRKQHEDWVPTAKQEWLERLEGGPGCWVMSETAGAVQGAKSGSEPQMRKGWKDLLLQVQGKKSAAVAAWLASVTVP